MKAKWPPHRSSVSPPRRPGASTSATPAPHSSTGSTPSAAMERSSCASMTRILSVQRRNTPTRSRPISSGWESSRTWCAANRSGWRPMTKQPQGSRPWAASTPPTRRRTSWTGVASGNRRSAGRRFMIAPPCAVGGRAGGARSVGPQAALALPARTGDGPLGRHRAGRGRIDCASLSDPVLRREDGTYLYTLPSVVDDIDFGVTHVIRGEDHVTNTAVQIQIFEALAGAAPCFGHHNLLTDAGGGGLSKRTGALSIASLRAKGIELARCRGARRPGRLGRGGASRRFDRRTGGPH